ncbi:hypothetical protein H6F43_14560 [Leptolyngbya sp. FACHB-36]|uniref:hypothetical protein n=1 Tax=Leptolyngbya sp. FACHB-36 TaxID=2692808 RepID=UPI001681451F|nr:hypothetical protein [Leptolyngbya sp. FACHB-36]MBD2021398.1 hypothetical protein [Leptolyngbya sp. FACHB-36]
MSLAIIAAVPTLANASTLTPQSKLLTEQFNSQAQRESNVEYLKGMPQPAWLIADKDDKKGRGRDDDDDDDKREVRVDLNRAKNLARQAAEAANGGVRVYRAEASMHGPASQCPYVDNGDSWTFTFLGGRPGATASTIESVVTVYKNSSRVLVAYNGSVRTTRQIQVQNFTTSQRTVLVDLLRGNCGCNYLLSNSLRTQIISQTRSLPPGIQKQLLRGKGLPPGIAKKLVPLPKQVNTYINLPAQYDLFVVGSNVVLIDQVRYTVVDLISNVL